MTILFAGGEDTSFTLFGSGTGTTFGGAGLAPNGRSAFCRAGITVLNTGAADPPANRYQTATFTAGSNLWIHGQVSLADGGPSVLNQQGLLVRSPTDNVSRIVVRQTATNGLWKVSSRNTAGTLTDLATMSAGVSVSATHQFDLHIDYSATGGIQLYVDTVLVLSFTGDPRTEATQLNQVDLAGLHATPFSTSNGWSEVIIADQDTRGMALWTIPPQAAGTTQSWTPNTVANISESVINDTTFVTTAANNALQEWTMPTAPPPGSWTFGPIISNARVRAALTGPQHFDWLCRTAAANYLASDPQAPVSGGTFANFQRQWTVNPATGLAWTAADVAAGLQFGIQSLA